MSTSAPLSEEKETANNEENKWSIENIVSYLFGCSRKYLPMATGGDKIKTGRSSQKTADYTDDGSEHDNPHDLEDNAKRTRDLVDLFKVALKQRMERRQSIIEEEDVEFATFDARRQLNGNKYDIKKWKEDPSIDVDPSLHALFQKSMAYAKTPKQTERILQAKQEQLKNKPDTSLGSIFEPLIQLKERLQNDNSTNLFAAILEIPNNQIDRADRMFYIEARRFVRTSTNYTFDIAHDQVQAIRLMHFEIADEDSISNFINKCPTFEAAYSYLRQLAKERVKKSEPNPIAKNAKAQKKPFVRSASQDEDDDNHVVNNLQESLYNSSLSNNNSPQPGSQQAGSSFGQGNHQGQNPDGKSNAAPKRKS